MMTNFHRPQRVRKLLKAGMRRIERVLIPDFPETLFRGQSEFDCNSNVPRTRFPLKPHHCLVHANPQLLQEGQAISETPRLIMNEGIFRELIYYFELVPCEFQLMGFVERDERNTFRVTELVVPPHTGGIAQTDIDQDAFPGWLDHLVREGKDIRALRFQAHSHGAMEAYFSPQDIATIRDEYSTDWMVSLVGNRRCLFVSRLDIFTPLPISISLPLIVEYPEPSATQDEETAWREKLACANKEWQHGGERE